MPQRLINTKSRENVVFIGIKKNIQSGQTIIGIRGSGFILKHKGEHYIVTCAHVYNEIPEADRMSIFCGLLAQETRASSDIQKYNFVDIELLAQHPDPRRDVCLFKFKEKIKDEDSYGYKTTDLVDEKYLVSIESLDDVAILGFPLANELMQMGMGITLSASKTSVGAIKFSSLDKKIDFILIDKYINPGSSGSPVFHKDKIIGLASGTLNQTHNISGAVINVPVNIGLVKTSNYIIELLNENTK